jgi:hypothetical protein
MPYKRKASELYSDSDPADQIHQYMFGHGMYGGAGGVAKTVAKKAAGAAIPTGSATLPLPQTPEQQEALDALGGIKEVSEKAGRLAGVLKAVEGPVASTLLPMLESFSKLAGPIGVATALVTMGPIMLDFVQGKVSGGEMLVKLALSVIPGLGPLVDHFSNEAKKKLQDQMNASDQAEFEKLTKEHDVKVNAEKEDLEHIMTAMDKLLESKIIDDKYLPFPVQPTKQENTVPSSGQSKYGAWNGTTSLTSRVILLTVGPSGEEIPPFTAAGKEDVRSGHEKAVTDRTAEARWDNMSAEERQAAIANGEEPPPNAPNASEGDEGEEKEPPGYLPSGFTLDGPGKEQAPMSDNGWIFQKSYYDKFLERNKSKYPDLKVVDAQDAQFMSEHDGKTEAEFTSGKKLEAQKSDYEARKALEPTTNEEYQSFYKWFTERNPSWKSVEWYDTRLQMNWTVENLQNWRKDTASATPAVAPQPIPTAEKLSPTDEAAFNKFKSENDWPELDNPQTQIEMWRQFTSEQKRLADWEAEQARIISGGSKLLHHAILHGRGVKRTRVDHRFF